MERLIRFSLPSYCNCIDSVQNLAQKPYCLCCQYDVNEYGYGPYGFTDKGKAVLKSLFSDIYHWKDNNLVEYHSWNFRNGLYFYDEKTWVESHVKAINNYNLQQKKAKLLKDKGIDTDSNELIPPLLTGLSDGHFKADVLNELINQNVKFFISHFFTPEAGETFILFDPSLTTKLPMVAEKQSVEFCDVGSIDELCAW